MRQSLFNTEPAPSYCEMAKKRIEKAQKQCELSFEEEKVCSLKTLKFSV